MIGHQAVRVKRTPSLPAQVMQEDEINQPIAIMMEAGLPVVATLPHMHGDFRDDQPRWPGHTATQRPTPIGR
jgi:hypothetical protein